MINTSLIYHLFIDCLLIQNFTSNFQTAKEALSAATVQAAEKAASSVRDFAQKSFRLAMDIKLKAPVIIIPQSTTSQDALVMDLGLITVGNSFSLLPVDGCPLPAVIDNMNVQLTQLKLSRSVKSTLSILIQEPLTPLLLLIRSVKSCQYLSPETSVSCCPPGPVLTWTKTNPTLSCWSRSTCT